MLIDFYCIADVAEQSGSRDLMLRAAELRESLANNEMQLANITKVSGVIIEITLW